MSLRKTAAIFFVFACVLNGVAAIKVAVLKFGNNPSHPDGIHTALEQSREFEATLITDVSAEILAGYQVLIWPQMSLGIVKETPDYQAYNKWLPIVKQWAENGGGLMVTHDAVGYRSHAALFPEIAKGVYHDIMTKDPFSAEIVAASSGSFLKFFHQKDRIPLSYNDYVVLEPGPQGVVLARGVDKTGDEAKSSGAVVVYGKVKGRGRYIANGSLPGMFPDNTVIPPSGIEKMFLFECVRYLAGLTDGEADAANDLGAEHTLGSKDPNLLLNGGFEKTDSRGRCPEITIYNAGTMLPEFSLSEAEFYSGKQSGRLTIKDYKPSEGGAGKGTVGVIFGDALHGAFGEKSQAIPLHKSAYKFSVWLKGDANNPRQPEARVLMYVWKFDQEGKLKRELIVPKNSICQLTPEWQNHTVQFFAEDFRHIVPMVSVTGTESDVPRKTLTGKLYPRTDLSAGTTIYLDEAELLYLERVDHAGMNVEEMRASGELQVKADWQNVTGESVPPIAKIMLGDSAEAPAEYLNMADYAPWPKGWKITSLSGDWRINKIPQTEKNPLDDEGTLKEYQLPDYDDSQWTERSVPGTWITEDKPLHPLAEEYVYGVHGAENFRGVGWYRTTFDIPEKPTDKSVFLHFDRVYYEAVVWLNGIKLGVNRAGDSPFEFEVTDALQAGKNFLSVRVWRPAAKVKYSIDGSYGGIVGDVVLMERPKIFTRSLLIDPKVSASEIEVKLELCNTSSQAGTVDLRVEIVPYMGNRVLLELLNPQEALKVKTQTVMSAKQICNPGITALDFKAGLENPLCWSPAYPFLYELVVYAGQEEIGKARFGFREFSTEANRFTLNDKGFYPKGVILSVPSPAPGVWNNQENVLRRFIAAHKVLGVNMVFVPRQHVFASRVFYDICDELGILINEWEGSTTQSLISTATLFDDDNIVRRIHYLYNHPSFAMYTIGNESRQQKFVEPINHVYDLFKQTDGQKRPVCAVTGGNPRVLKFKEDMVDVHSYPGGIYGHPLDETEVFENANREVWAAHGKALPLGNWEMGGSKLSMTAKEYAQGKEIFAAQEPDKEKLIQGIIQVDSGYHMGLGLRWATLYGLRRHLVDAPALLAEDPDFEVLRREAPEELQKREWFWAAKYYTEWTAKNILEDCRRLGELMRGGFGINLGRVYSFFYLRDHTGRFTVKQHYPWFELWKLPEGTLAASELYATYKRVLNDRFICADVFGRNCFAGGKLELVVYAINDTQVDQEGWQARVAVLDKQGKVITDKRAGTGTVRALTRNLLPFNFDLPVELETGFYDLRLYLTCKNEILSDNHYEFFVLSQSDLDSEIDAGINKIALYDKTSQAINTTKVFDQLRVKYTHIDNFNSLGDYDVLVIGAESYDAEVLTSGEIINAWLKTGGRLLQFEQYSPNSLSWLPQMSVVKRTGGSVGSLIVPGHPVFDKISASANWDIWNGRLEQTSRYGKQGGIFAALLRPLNKTALALGCQDTPRATDAAVQMLVSDIKVEDGRALVSQAAATYRYGNDSVATKFVHNCVKYILADETSYPEPVSGLNILNIDYRRCGYLKLSETATRPIQSSPDWLNALEQGLKSCGGVRFKLPSSKALPLQGKIEFAIPDSIEYMDPEWEAQKQVADHDQGALLKNRIDTLFILLALPEETTSQTPARLTLVFRDGSEASKELVLGRDAASAAHASDLENAAYVGNGFYLTQWLSPNSDTEAVKLVISTAEGNELLLGGITMTLVRDKVHGL